MARNLINKLTPIASAVATLQKQEANADLFKLILKYGLVEQLALPLKTAESLFDFSDSLGCLASLVDKLIARQTNALVAAHWRETTPDAEKVKQEAFDAQAEQDKLVPWDEVFNPEMDNGQEHEVHDARSVVEIEDTLRILYNAAISLFNSRDDMTRWLGGTHKPIVEVLGDGTIKRTQVQTRLHSWCSPRDRIIQAMAFNQHRDGMWYTKQFYFVHTYTGGELGFAHMEIHDVKDAVNEHLLEEIEIDGRVTTRLAEVVPMIADRKWDQYIERLMEGRAGSADLNLWVAYSPKRVEFANAFADSLEFVEYLDEQQKAKEKLAERTNRLNAYRALQAGGAPAPQASTSPAAPITPDLTPSALAKPTGSIRYAGHGERSVGIR